jgi:hypothetical protein
MAAYLVNLLGFTTGAALYAMLLWMVVRSHRPDRRWFWSRSDRLSLLTGFLGLVWNVGAFSGYELHALGLLGPSPVLLALSFSALGFLPAVVVHSVVRARGMPEGVADRGILLFAYALSGAASIFHVLSAILWQAVPSQTALQVLTAGFGVVLIALLAKTRRTPGWGRALWVVALAVFAVSALHLSNHRGTDPWWVELLGHHASLPLALAFLIQDYRFALADIFLKRALALVLLVTLVFGIYVLGPEMLLSRAGAGGDPQAVLMLLGLWVATALAYPWIRSIAEWFIDDVVLKRPDYDMLVTQASHALAQQETPESIFEELKQLIGPALSAGVIQWREEDGFNHLAHDLVTASATDATVVIPTADAPHYVLSIREFEGGRRLLSDDITALEKLALLAGRRVDVVRTTQERLERNLREREISRLAAEAELRALRAQIHPHFLFNALTTIAYLIQSAPDRALSTLMRLSGLLRSVLRSSPEFSTLGEELAIITAYLDIEQARFEDRLIVKIEVTEELRQFRVPAFLLQPLVENAIKHGIGKSRAGGRVRIVGQLRDQAAGELPLLCLIVEDSGAGCDELELASGRRRGVGLNNVERRLQCYGAGAARMRLASRPGQGMRVEVTLPAEMLAGTEASDEPVSASHLQ